MAIAAAGSCFAQHIGKHFKTRGYSFLDLEPPPPSLAPSLYADYGFDLYSARYGNVYSIRQLLQLFKRACGSYIPKETSWEQGGRFYDPFRPSIEPQGFASKLELERDCAYHLLMLRSLLPKTELFVFTFGLTEAWLADDAVLPTCPGTIAGNFDETRHRFHNFNYREVLADAEEFIAMALATNPSMKFLFTVSPVPLTATATSQHVLPATVRSKSVLRAVCGELYDKYPQVDYFPSYELVSSHPMRAMFYQPNLRNVAATGVQHVMDTFFSAHPSSAHPAAENPEKAIGKQTGAPDTSLSDDTVCDEAILEAFAR